MMINNIKKMITDLKVTPGSQINLRKNYDPGYVGKFLSKEDARISLENGIRQLALEQDKLYAQNTYALLIILQALDAAGKDGTIKNVMSGVNPQGVQVTSFKAPTSEDLDHDYLWRSFKALPNRGNIGIFNRSYYEEVLVVRVHPELLNRQQIPPQLKDKNIWKQRYEEINNFEKYLVNNGTFVLKIFLNVSKEIQKKRFMERVREPEKNWKFSICDINERKYWDDYMDAYEDMFNNTSTPWAPWYIVPADHKWFTRLAVVSIINSTLEGLKLEYPDVSKEQKEELSKAEAEMENEGTNPNDSTSISDRKKKKQKDRKKQYFIKNTL
jgi:PPK2 family polyphosphate:nucleotide phosphotransferase